MKGWLTVLPAWRCEDGANHRYQWLYVVPSVKMHPCQTTDSPGSRDWTVTIFVPFSSVWETLQAVVTTLASPVVLSCGASGTRICAKNNAKRYTKINNINSCNDWWTWTLTEINYADNTNNHKTDGKCTKTVSQGTIVISVTDPHCTSHSLFEYTYTAIIDAVVVELTGSLSL